MVPSNGIEVEVLTEVRPYRSASGEQPDMMKNTHKSLMIALVITVFAILGGLHLGSAHIGFHAPPQSPGAQASSPPTMTVELVPPSTPAKNPEPSAAPMSATAPTAASPQNPPYVADSSRQAGSILGSAAPIISGDAVAGRQVFKKCEACHSLEPGKNLIGPSLAGVVGRKAGSEPGYDYSPAMKQANIIWSPATLDTYLTDPQKVVPGNKMPFPGLKTDRDRADVIVLLSNAEGKLAQPAAAASTAAAPNPGVGYLPDAKYTLRSGIAQGRLVYIGVGGDIDGKVNPVLSAAEGQVVQLTLINGEGAEHDIVFPDQNAKSPRVTGKGASTTIAFRAARSGDFTLFLQCPWAPGCRHAGPVHRHTEASGAGSCGGGHLARADRLAIADRQARSADGPRRPS